MFLIWKIAECSLNGSNFVSILLAEMIALKPALDVNSEHYLK